MKPFLIVLLANSFVSFLRIIYVIYTPLDLSPEEAQYWDWSRHLDLSYYSKPPMVAYLNFISTSLLGNSELAVRITPILLAFLLSLITFLFVRELFNDRVAIISAILPNLFVGYSLNALLMTTDAPFLFFWALSVISLYFAFERDRLSLWTLVGLFSGLAFLSKYPAVFLLPLALTYGLIYGRDKLRSFKPYISLLIAFILSLPVLVWNYQRDFVSFKHVSTLSSKSEGVFKVEYLLNYLGGQALLLSVVFFPLLIWGWYIALRDRDKRLIFLTLFSLPVFLFFLALSLKKNVYANWAGFGYFSGGVLIAYVFGMLRKGVLLPLSLISTLLIILMHHTPLLDRLGLGNILPPKKDPLKFLVGWEELGRRVSEIYSEGELLFSNKYQISAELAFYVEGNPRTFVLHSGERMNQYDLWKPMISKYIHRDAVFVSYEPIPKNILEGFEGVLSYEVVPIYWRGEVVREFHIYKLKNFSGKVEEVIKGY